MSPSFDNTSPGPSACLQGAIELFPSMLCVFSPDACFQLLNHGWSDLLGYATDELRGRSLYEFLCSEDHAAMAEALALRPFSSVTISNRFRCRDGSLKWLEWRISSPAENPLFYAVVRDITNQRRIEIDLEASEKRYRSIFMGMQEGFALHEIICDAQGAAVDYRFLEVNPAFENLTGLKAADIISRTVKEVIPGIEPFWIEKYGKVALTGVPEIFEEYTASVGLHFRVFVFCPQQGQFAVFFEDITPRKSSERALHEAERESKMLLQKIITVREQEKKKLSVDLHDETGTMAVVLNAEIGVMREELKRGNYDEVARGIEKMKAVVEQEVRAFRKIVYELRPPNLALAGLAGVLRDYFSELTTAFDLSIRFSADEVNGLEDRIAMMIYRITQEAFTNIIRHAQAGTVDVSFRLDNCRLTYIIRDDGIGFDLQQVGKSDEGSRLGIQGMKERAEALGANLTIRSAPGKGTEVQLAMFLPREELR